ncbi:tRNA(m5U54)methyltransferase [Serendipita sp. 396]|nr:tRNA(m5U54)methyltransferase [Serendipita sp. 396]KAG8784428.1 tRNA(m5U54)methyltransferase [Serendipita sp. 397]KAG8824713.1 tRNA(m5U54)methyltransferase [Serendipita sp. 401]KAG8834074.1 tRNA(m5U54)methyltransferase [Serendipita sp. 400]KAG8856399.1 tRNA(m5U54)methyltransferase [Serendipita sp. 411]KAG8871325.1 tRNA(m5U54)methyltransferase [Serendipita sp. 405]KAG9054275.1 tRNA(m5U54)methyltransferase [Serendipita sp. 407]
MDLSPTRQNLRDQEAHERIQDERPTKKARLEDGERTDNMIQPRKTTKQKQKLSKRALQKILHHEPGTPGDVLWHEINELLGRNIVDDAIVAGRDLEASVQFGDILELDVVEISSTGDSLSILPAPHPPWVVATPFSLPGERIRVKIVRNGRMLSHADLLGIVQSNQALRDDSRVKCRYFGECSGCQYQMLDYATQLDFKRHVIQKAYRFYSNLSAEMIPSPSPTIASPLQYGYRTKITPHFDEPPKGKARSAWIPWIGFDSKGRRRVLDIEECPIATSTLNQALGPIRKEVQEQIDNYKRGATLLMRDSLATIPQQDGDETHVCIRDHKAIVRERVGTTLFEFPANSFFQNNNSVLVPLTDYVREAALSVPADGKTKQPTHLIDTYSGCGLFALRLVDSFDRVVGIEISEESIRYATHNVKLNGIPEDKCEFRAGQAERIFEVVQDFPPKETAIVIDPPRKGCDDKFIEQLLSFGAATIVYVSCNVHTQARDVGKIVSGGRDYTVESIRGFDLFPQTAHVESVAILRRG